MNRTALAIGILGASRIAPKSIIEPARELGHTVVMVAARDPERAREFASVHAIPVVAPNYAALVADPRVQVVYNALPNALHGHWNARALESGKAVISEKPFASNANEAARVLELGARTGGRIVEGFHYVFHPAMARVRSALEASELGIIRHVDAALDIPRPTATDPRLSARLAGGALMDVGCYGLHVQQTVARWTGDTLAIAGARGRPDPQNAGVDASFEVDLEFGSGASGAVRCSMEGARERLELTIVGSLATLTVHNFVLPHNDDRVSVRDSAGIVVEHVGRTSSYTHQLAAFAPYLAGRADKPPVHPDESLAVMRMIDQALLAAGWQPRAALGR